MPSDTLPCHRILLIEDHAPIAELVRMHLSALNARVVHIGDGREGLLRALGGGFSLVVLDLTLPSLDGLEVCRRLRRTDASTPILVLSARGDEADRVLGLDMGADDYLCKPFSVLELRARVRALLRRVGRGEGHLPQAQRPQLRFGDLLIDCEQREVRLGSRSIPLTAREFDLLCCFARHPGRVFSRTQLLDQVWGYGHDGYEHTVNSHINRLRAKLEPDPARPTFVLTVRGVGYKFAAA